MFRRRVLFGLMLPSLVVLTASAAVGVPHLVNYQGILLDSGGSPVTTTTSVLFTIWDDPNAGDSLWSETQSVTPDTDGRFNAILGSVSAIPDSAFVGDVYLSIKIDTDPELSPRSQIISVGYSFRVGTVDSASGGTINGTTVIQGASGQFIEFDVEDSNPVMVIKDPGGGVRTARFGGADTLFNGFDDSDQLRMSGRVNSSEGGVLTYYDSTGAKLGRDFVDGLKKLELRQDTVLFFGEGAIDSTLVFSSDGNIYGVGTITMGGGNINTGVDANVVGSRNTAAGDSSAIGGGSLNSTFGRLSTISGGQNNMVNGRGAAVSGGIGNMADGDRASVGGGEMNNAGGPFSAVGGGQGNFAGGMHAAIAGGTGNVADADAASVGGGIGNIASGQAATVCGGQESAALGNHSIAAGYQARANHEGSVVIAANGGAAGSGDSVQSGCAEQMVLRADGGFYLTNGPGQVTCEPQAFLNTATGAFLSVGGDWINMSDRDAKENFEAVDGGELLERLAGLSIAEWNYKGESRIVRHVGPTAQDFHALFGLGGDDRTISTVDPVGIALVAIQELHRRSERVAEQERRIDELVGQVAALQTQLRELVAMQGR